LKNNPFNYRINNQIQADKVRVIDPDGKQVGVLSLKQALEEAQKQGLDLIEIAPKANPPVTRIINLGKFKYQEEKKRKKEKRESRKSELKEVRFSPFIAEADYETRLLKIKGFLDQKNKVRVVVKFKGKEMGSKQFGYKLLEKLINQLGESINLDMKPKFLGRYLTMIISPLSKGKRQETGPKQKPSYAKAAEGQKK